MAKLKAKPTPVSVKGVSNPGIDAPSSELVDETSGIMAQTPPEISDASVTVTWQGNSRVYSQEIHGKDYKALAKEFAAHITCTPPIFMRVL